MLNINIRLAIKSSYVYVGYVYVAYSKTTTKQSYYTVIVERNILNFVWWQKYHVEKSTPLNPIQNIPMYLWVDHIWMVWYLWFHSVLAYFIYNAANDQQWKSMYTYEVAWADTVTVIPRMPPTIQADRTGVISKFQWITSQGISHLMYYFGPCSLLIKQCTDGSANIIQVYMIRDYTWGYLICYICTHT